GSAAGGASATAAPARVLLHLPTAEIIRLGLVSNRGMVMFGAVIAVLAQNGSDLLGRVVENLGRSLLGFGERLHLDAIGWTVGALALLLLAVIVLRLLSIGWNLLNYHDFTLGESGRRLS